MVTVTNHYQQQGNMSSRFSSNSEVFASELLENLEEMIVSNFKYLSTLNYATCNEKCDTRQ